MNELLHDTVWTVFALAALFTAASPLIVRYFQ
jgi:predicted metal-binding membrane protein